MRGLRRLIIAALVLGLVSSAPASVVACNNGVTQCSNNYGATETVIGAGGPANQSAASQSSNYVDYGSTVGDVAVGTSQSGSTYNQAGGDLMADDFETWSGWSTYGTGVISQSNAAQHGGQYSLLKDTHGDPNGGYKLLTSATNRDWRMDVWVMKPSLNGTADSARLGIEDSSYNGYSFNINFGSASGNLKIEKRTGGTAATIGTTSSLSMSLNKWYRVIFSSNSASNSLAMTVYDSNGLTQLAELSTTDTTYSGPFDRVVVHGGYPYYIDNLDIFSSAAGYRVASGFNTPQDPTLTFLVNTALVDLGILSYSNPSEGTATFSVKNYTSYGYVVQTVGSPPTAGSHTLAAMNGSSSAGTEQFGINLAANNVSGAQPSSTFGAGPSQVPGSTYSFGEVASGYGVPNQFKYNDGDIIAQAEKSSGETDYTISYLVNISTNTLAGLYQMNQVLVCTGTY